MLPSFIWSAALLFPLAWGLKYTDCGSKTGKIVSVKMTGCEDEDICELKRGETYNYEVKFESLTASKRLRAVLNGIINGVAMPFPLPNANACEHSDIECPIKNGESYTYSYDIEVRDNYPTLRADVKWQLKDDKNKDVVCVLLPVKVV
ncbi:NPC intracellular cholesterol transporter 2 homolog a-like [Parasteatoda tepidariorum]|uniref:NPC intracellular cholesterol transporter 2 homolog a-like n=1 Tax=Parasteatoda tepidariorum TaxID=114398 RepID=UPI001C727CCC|nr:NPC intracellular cholesterol transporter 2 homolog a-like [Parasteatoda tepidariorum]